MLLSLCSLRPRCGTMLSICSKPILVMLVGRAGGSCWWVVSIAPTARSWIVVRRPVCGVMVFGAREIEAARPVSHRRRRATSCSHAKDQRGRYDAIVR